MGNYKLALLFTIVIALEFACSRIQVYRYGVRDVFQNPKLPSAVSFSECNANASCKGYMASCFEAGYCCLCRCMSKFSTFSVGKGRCVNDEIFLRGASFRFIRNGKILSNIQLHELTEAKDLGLISNRDGVSTPLVKCRVVESLSKYLQEYDVDGWKRLRELSKKQLFKLSHGKDGLILKWNRNATRSSKFQGLVIRLVIHCAAINSSIVFKTWKNYNDKNFIGCIAPERKLTHIRTLHTCDVMTPSLCKDFCRALGRSLALLRGATNCLCEEFSQVQNWKRDELVCVLPCPGDPSKLCGGNESYSAYRTMPGYFFPNRKKIDLLPKCPKSGCSRRVYNSLNARNLTSCQILWEESSWFDADTEMSNFFNKTRPSFTFKNYKNEIYFEWKSNPYSSLAGTLVNLTIQCLSLNNKFREFSFHVKIKDVVYETITGRYQFIQLKNQSLSVEDPNIHVLNLSNGCHDSVCSRQIDAPLKINKSNAVCNILGEESTLMRSGSSSMNLGNMRELFSLNNVTKSLRLQWKATSNSLLNKTIFNLTILCYDDQNENQTIAEKSYLIFQTISNPDEKKPTTKESADLLLEIILPVTFLFILLVVLLVVFCCCYRRRRQRFPKSDKHSSSAVNLQDNIGNQYPTDDLGTRSIEDNDNPCYQEYCVTSNPAVTIARNRLYETTTVFKQSRPDSEIYEKPVDSVKLRKKVFDVNKPTNSPKTARPPSPSPGRTRKMDLLKAKFEQTNSQDDDEMYDEPLRFIPGKSEYDTLNVDSTSLPSNKLSSPYTKQSSTSPEQDDVTYDYVTRDDIRTGLSKYPKQYPAEKPFEMTIDKETPRDPPLYATLDHDNGQN